MENGKQLMTISETQTLAKTVAASGLFTAFKDPNKAMVLMLLAQAEGCPAITATQRYDVIDGKPAKKSDAMLADFQSRGGTVEWVEYSASAVEGKFMARGLGAPVSVRWSIEMAQAAGLASKDVWKKYPRAMLKARVISEGIRIADPHVVAGLYTPEEVADFDVPPVRVLPVTEIEPKKSAAVVDAEVVETKAPTVEMASPAQIKKIFASADEAGIPKDREGRLFWLSQNIGRTVESSKELTKQEATTLIDSMEFGK